MLLVIILSEGNGHLNVLIKVADSFGTCLLRENECVARNVRDSFY